jgi:hypothetical protein
VIDQSGEDDQSIGSTYRSHMESRKGIGLLMIGRFPVLSSKRQTQTNGVDNEKNRYVGINIDDLARLSERMFLWI